MSFSWINSVDDAFGTIRAKDSVLNTQRSANDSGLHLGGKPRRESSIRNKNGRKPTKTNSNRKRTNNIIEIKDTERDRAQENVTPPNVTEIHIPTQNGTETVSPPAEDKTLSIQETSRISTHTDSVTLSQDEFKVIERQFGDSESNLVFDKNHYHKVVPNLQTSLTNLEDVYDFFSQFKSKYYRNLFVKEYDNCHLKSDKNFLISLPDHTRAELGNIPKLESIYRYDSTIRNWAISILNLTLNDRYVGILALQAISITMSPKIFQNFQKLILMEVPNYETASILIFVDLFVNFFESHKLNLFLHMFNTNIINSQDWLKRYKLISQFSSKDWESYGVQALMLTNLPHDIETTLDKSFYVDFKSSNEWLHAQLANIDDTKINDNIEDDYIFEY